MKMTVNFSFEIGNKAFDLTEAEATALYEFLKQRFEKSVSNIQINPYTPNQLIPNIQPYVSPSLPNNPWQSPFITTCELKGNVDGIAGK